MSIWLVECLRGHLAAILPKWKLKFSTLRLNTVEQTMVTFVGWRVFGEVVVQTGLWPGPKSHHRKASYSAAGEVSSLRLLTNYTLHLWRKPSSWLGAWSWLGCRENCSVSGRNAPESKVTPVSYSAVSPNRALIVRAKIGEKLLSIHQGTNMINCVLPGKSAYAAFD